MTMHAVFLINFLVIVASANAQFAKLLKPGIPPALEVGIGQSVPLTSRHLPIHQRAQNGDLCRVEVDDNEPLSLMVGRLEPKKFNCFFRPNAVIYHHEGSPLTAADTIKLTLYYFWRNNSVSDTAFIEVRINLKTSPVIFEPQANLTVKTSKATTIPISSDVLRFRYNPKTELCTVSYASLRAQRRRDQEGPWMATRKWPAIGRVVDYRKKIVTDFEHDCQQMLLMGYRYEHRKPGSPDFDFVPLTVRVQKKGLGPRFIEKRESFFLQVVVRNAAPNLIPKLSVGEVELSNMGGTLEPLPTKAISIEKDESRRRFLTLNVTWLRGRGAARLVNKRDASKAIYSFTYEDYKAGKIFFQLEESGRKTVHHIGLQAVDGYMAKSLERVLQIRSQPMANLRFQFFNEPILTYTDAASLVRNNSFQVFGPNAATVRHMQRSMLYRVMSSMKGDGYILVNGLMRPQFSPSDVRYGLVVYKHRNKVDEANSLPVKAVYMSKSARLSVPVHIVKLHDRRSALQSTRLKVLARGSVCLGLDLVNKDVRQYFLRDRVDLTFMVASVPSQGFLVRCVGKVPDRLPPTGRLRAFTFQDLVLRRICYRHTGNDDDQFAVVQVMSAIRGRLPPITIYLDVEPVSPLRLGMDPAIQPKEMLQVRESANSIKLTNIYLNYSAPGVSSTDVRYSITMFPRFIGINTTLDAGRLVNVNDLVRIGHTGDMQMTSVVKDLKAAQIGTVASFTQQQIDAEGIVYVPPLNDVGETDRLVMFKFNVSSNGTATVTDQKLVLRVKAEDNQPPTIKLKLIKVKRGDTYAFTIEDIRVADIDTPLDKVMVEVTKLPRYGELKDEKGRTMLTNYRFPATAILTKKIQYVNDGRNFKADSFNMTVSDGPRTSNVTTVHLNITNYDWEIGGWKAYVNNIIQVNENSSVVIREAALPKPTGKYKGIKNATILQYLIYELPVKGVFLRNNSKVDQYKMFTLADIRADLIRYNHSGGEIGARKVYDFARVSLYINGNYVSYQKINFSILPVNSQPPRVVVSSSLIVTEGRQDANNIVGVNILAAIDRDTAEKNVRIRMIERPSWGQILVNGKEVFDFSMAQVRTGRVRYVQARGKGVEETSDQFTVTASDGDFLSSNKIINITIIPVNDEPPKVLLKNFTIDSGGRQPLNSAIFKVEDADIPKDEIRIHITRLPKAGNLWCYWGAGDRELVTPMSNVFSTIFLTTGHLLYEHNSKSLATKDSFEIMVTDGRHRVRRTCYIRVLGENRLAPALLSSRPLVIEGDVLGILTKKQLSAVDADTPPDSLVFNITVAPPKGTLVRLKKIVGGFTAKLPINVYQTFTQADVDAGSIAYMYLGKQRDRVDDSLTVVLSDGKHKLPPRKLIIVCSNLPQEKPPLELTSSVVRVERDGEVILTTRDIIIKNSVTPVERLKVEIFQMARCGMLVDTKAASRASLTNFLYKELYDRRIVLSVRDCPRDTRELAIKLVVRDMGARAQALLRVIIQALPPVVKRFLSVQVQQGKTVKIGPELVKTEDPDTPASQIFYTLVGSPKYGALIRAGLEILEGESFTQQEVDQRLIAYASLKFSPSGTDIIRLNITDGDHTTFGFAGRPGREGPLDLPIIIKPTVQLLKLIIKRDPSRLEQFAGVGFGYRLSKENLKSNFPNVTRFVVRQKPMFGRLSLQARPEVAVDRFSSMDLSRGALLYTLDQTRMKRNRTKDIFTFVLEVDAMGKKKELYETDPKKQYIMNFNWSRVQFIKRRYKVCQRAGFLKLRILRFGNLNIKSKVTIELQRRGSTTAVGREFMPSTNKAIEFNAGEKEVIYRMQINDPINRRERRVNGRKRSKKRIRVSFSSVSNALIGEISSANIIIKEAKKCGDVNEKDFITPAQNMEELKILQEKNAINMKMFQDPRDKGVLDDLPSSDELRKYAENFRVEQNPNIPQCTVENHGKTIKHNGKEHFCHGVKQEWISIDEIYGGSCDKDWIPDTKHKTCYRFFSAQLRWSDANLECGRNSAILVEPKSRESQDWITKKIALEQEYWTGVRYNLMKGFLPYMGSKKLPSYTQWHKKPPNFIRFSRRQSIRGLKSNKGRQRDFQRCITVHPLKNWMRRRCFTKNQRYGFVCQKPTA